MKTKEAPTKTCECAHNPKTTEHEYTVDENGQRIDGYTENWLTMRPVIPRALKPPPGK